MLHLLKIEWLKIRNYPAFWWVMAITIIAYPAMSFLMLSYYNKLIGQLPPGTAAISLSNPFAPTEIWHTVSYLASLFVFVPAIVVIMLIANEYRFKTYRQNIIDGLSRNQFLTGKLLGVAIISLLATIILIGVCISIGFSQHGATNQHGNSTSYFIGYFFLQTFSQLSIAFLIGMLLRRSFIALAGFLFFMMMLEPILTGLLSSNKLTLGHYLPFEISDRMIPPPAFMGKLNPEAYEKEMHDTKYHLIYTIAFTGLLWTLCFRLNRRKDI